MSGERYTPTPAEIREACEQIQSSWDEREELNRRAVPCEPARIPEVRCGD